MGEEKTTHCPLGDPLTILNRDADPTLPQSIPPTPRREIIWKISADKIGTHVIKLRYVHRTMRTDPGRPTRRAQVAVAVVD